MINLPKDVAERLYAIYAATLTNPVPLEEMVLTDRVQWAYEKGKVKPEQQLSWLHNLHNQNADLHEPYDMGVLNALRISMFIFTDKPINFVGKPKHEDLQEALDKTNKRAMALAKKAVNLQAKVKVLKEDHALEMNETLKKTSEELATVKKDHVMELSILAENRLDEVGGLKNEAVNLKEAIKKLRSDLKAAKSALKTASVTV